MEKTKNIISFDVGMKNLAYCIFQVCETNSKVKILQWDVINLCTPIVRKCNTLGCTQDAKYCKTFRTTCDDVEEEDDEEACKTAEKGEKGEKDEINIVNGMLDESVYDKLLTLVSMDKRKIFDRKTRKNKSSLFQKVKSNSTRNYNTTDEDIDVDTPTAEKAEKINKKKSMKIKLNTQLLPDKQKSNQNKTKKVRFVD